MRVRLGLGRHRTAALARPAQRLTNRSAALGLTEKYGEIPLATRQFFITAAGRNSEGVAYWPFARSHGTTEPGFFDELFSNIGNGFANGTGKPAGTVTRCHRIPL